ncbi:MAG: DUF4255 domain-containing protein, partial [Psychrosphaera sp.]|nr:DUF4255 domain-containing protein [Psychrosphaera sp.]
MASYSLLNDLTTTLQHNLYHALDTAADDNFGMTSATSEIVLESPQTADLEHAASKVSLYLYHMGINGHLRNQPMVGLGTEGLMKPPLPFQLKYLITPVNGDHFTHQLMLGRIIQYLYDNPILTNSATLPMNDDKGGTTELRIHPDNLSIESLNQIWTAMSEPYRLSYSFTVDVVTI